MRYVVLTLVQSVNAFRPIFQYPVFELLKKPAKDKPRRENKTQRLTETLRRHIIREGVVKV